MFKTSFLAPRNVIVISIMTILAHIVLRPIYNKIDSKGVNEND